MTYAQIKKRNESAITNVLIKNCSESTMTSFLSTNTMPVQQSMEASRSVENLPVADYRSLIEPVAFLLCKEPNARLSKPDDLRFGTHGSLSVKPSTGQWHDHETNTGGGTLDLVQHLGVAPSRAGAHRWLVEQGLVRDAPQPTGPKRPPASTETSYQYQSADGALLFEVVRKPNKKFQQRRPDPNNSSQWIWNLQGVQRVLYRLPYLLAAPVDTVVFVVEGEKDVDRLESLGLVATCNSGGAGKWLPKYSQALQDRTVVILPDNDDAGRTHVQQVVQSLVGIAASVCVVALPNLPAKGDISDWLDAGHTRADLDALVAATTTEALTDKSSADDEKELRKSQTDLLVEYVTLNFDLVHDENRDGLVVDRETKETFRLSSSAFRDDLLARFYREFKLSVRKGALREAMMTLQALARDTDAPRKANLRVATIGGEYFLDLARPRSSQVVRLLAGYWEIVDKPETLFVRGDSMLPLVDPVKGGDVNLLWRIVNVPDDQRVLVLAWLVDCLRPDTPYPLLELTGEQGSGKSVSSEALRRLIDPNAANLRAEPKSADDLFVIAHHNHIVALENVSRLTSQQQDAACILSTGGGFAKRKLYSDSDEVVISLRRPVLINGIVPAITQQDLVDRCVSIDCPVIEARLTSTEMWREFEQNLPHILGGLLDLGAKALKLLPDVNLPAKDRPRLVEFALLGCAVAMAQNQQPEVFMNAFTSMRVETVSRTLEASPIAVAVQEFIETVPGGFTGPLKDILRELDRFKPVGTDAWPRSPKGLGDALRRAAPALRTLGIECKSQGRGRNNIHWCIQRKKDETHVREVRKSAPPEPESADMRTLRTSVLNVSSDLEVF